MKIHLLFILLVIFSLALFIITRRKKKSYYQEMFNLIKNNPPTIVSASQQEEYDLGKMLIKQREEYVQPIVNEEGNLEEQEKKDNCINDDTVDNYSKLLQSSKSLDEAIDKIETAGEIIKNNAETAFCIGKKIGEKVYKIGVKIVNTLAKVAEKAGCFFVKCTRPEYAVYITFGIQNPVLTTYIRTLLKLVCSNPINPINENNYSFPMLLSDFNSLFSNLIFYYKIYNNSSLSIEDKQNICASICLITIGSNMNANFMIEGFGSSISSADKVFSDVNQQPSDGELSKLTLITPEVVKLAEKILQKKEIDYIEYEEFKILVYSILSNIFEISKFLDISIEKYTPVPDMPKSEKIRISKNEYKEPDIPKSEKINIIIYMTVLYGLMFSYDNSYSLKVSESLKKFVPEITQDEINNALNNIQLMYNNNKDASLSSIFDVCTIPVFSNFSNCKLAQEDGSQTTAVQEFMKKESPCVKYVVKNT